ncbi:hypothetical protein [Spiroplasma endosymbiont of Acasis viretata]|uniref:hypothetical protein n=1 Tax=Spiroplasma endosymbiont of Acasis viretata TaxID=3066306 RepID=UPI00313DD756
MINSPFINDFQDLKNKKIQKVIIAPNGTIYAGSSTTGLWKSTDGVNFKQVSGIPNSYIRSFISLNAIGLSKLRFLKINAPTSPPTGG